MYFIILNSCIYYFKFMYLNYVLMYLCIEYMYLFYLNCVYYFEFMYLFNSLFIILEFMYLLFVTEHRKREHLGQK